MTNVKLSQLVNNYENISWHNLYTVDSQLYLKNVIEDPILSFPSEKNKSVLS